MTSSQTASPWFAVSMGLLGIIVGYTVASAGAPLGLPSIATPPPPPAVAPTPPPPAAAPAPTPTAPTAQPAAVDAKVDHIRGKADARITLIEYSDFECPFCQRHHPTMRQVLDTYKNDVNWVYRHYPLSFHSKAMPAAKASECVAEVGGNDAFWKFMDVVMEKKNFDFVAVAKEIGVDEAKYNACIQADTYTTKINAQQQDGANAGVRGTPGTIVIDNKTKQSVFISGAVAFDRFKTTIDGMLAK